VINVPVPFFEPEEIENIPHADDDADAVGAAAGP
jgi:hypothetical protein